MKRTRKQPSPDLDPQAPPEIRQRNATVLRTKWRDPDDMRPNVRCAREITGYRAMCPLRQIQHRCGAASSITEVHILAADPLRAQADAVAIGFSGNRPLLPIQRLRYGPLTGPSTAAIRSVKAWPALLAALRLFDAEQRRLLTWVVLLNKSVAAWCAGLREQGRTITASREMHRLVEILDLLADHYGIEDDHEARLA